MNKGCRCCKVQECHMCTFSSETKDKTQLQSEVQGQTEGNTSFLAHRESFVHKIVKELITVQVTIPDIFKI